MTNDDERNHFFFFFFFLRSGLKRNTSRDKNDLNKVGFYRGDMDGGLTEAARFTRFQSHRINKEIELTAISYRRWLVNKIKQPVAPPIRRYPSHVVRKQEIITGWFFVFPPVPPDVQLWRYVFLSSHTLLFGPVLFNRMWRRERVDITKPGPLKRLFFRWAFAAVLTWRRGLTVQRLL